MSKTLSGKAYLQSWVGPQQGLTDLMRATQQTLEIIGCGEREKLIFFEQLIHELTFFASETSKIRLRN